MAETAREVELKLEVAPADIGRLKRRLRDDRRVLGDARVQHLESTYFDTAKRALRDAGLTLRLRRNGTRAVQTIKQSDGSASGLIDRGEWESEVRAGGPDFSAARGTPLKRHLTRKTRKTLKPLFRTDVKRTSYTFGGNGSQVEVALDEGRVVAGRRTAPICEVEIELKRGEPAALFALARELERQIPVRLDLRSKSERGYALVDKMQTRPVKAGTLRLERRAGAAQAFRAIAMSCLHQLMANEPAMLRGDAEALHQMRVALRRLRAALSLFSDMIADTKVEEIKSGLKWMAVALAPARDLEVFAKEAVEPARRRHRGDPGMSELEATVARHEAAALDRAKAAIVSRRFRMQTLATAEWIESGPWTKARSPAVARLREQPLHKHARQELSRRWRKIAKKGRILRELSTRQRHKLRIAVKKLRYGVDFFAGAFPGHKAKKRRKDFAQALKMLQNALGSLNDVAVRDKLGADLASAGTSRSQRTASRRQAFAAGLVVGEQDARVEELLADGIEALHDLRQTAPFWK
jgi:inorganic triphosphatase YgiF